MNERQFCKLLEDLIIDGEDIDSLVEIVQNVRTFREAGIMSGNHGLVFKLEDGSEFQVTIVQSKTAEQAEREA